MVGKKRGGYAPGVFRVNEAKVAAFECDHPGIWPRINDLVDNFTVSLILIRQLPSPCPAEVAWAPFDSNSEPGTPFSRTDD